MRHRAAASPSHTAPPGMGGARRFVLLDRDGTLVEERGYITEPLDLRLLPHAAAALRELRAAGLGLVVVTNQSAVGRGMMDLARLDAIHARLEELLAAEGATLDGIYACPHAPDDSCDCRKPRSGLITRAVGDHGFSPPLAFVVGDHETDIELGARVGATTVLVRTGHGERTASREQAQADFVVGDLAEAARLICGLVASKEGERR